MPNVYSYVLGILEYGGGGMVFPITNPYDHYDLCDDLVHICHEDHGIMNIIIQSGTVGDGLEIEASLILTILIK